MDVSLDKDWKNKLGFQINFKSESSEEDPDLADVVMRRAARGRRSAEYLLDDVGDGAEADLLSSTPPRALIRKKEKARRCDFARNNVDEAGFQKMMKDRRNTTVYVSSNENAVIPDRLKKRWSLKRSTDRDWKQEMGQRGEHKADSLPEPPAVPTLVESCSRFMSLTSKLKCRAACAASAAVAGAAGGAGGAGGAGEAGDAHDQLPESRVTFHRTFSMLINMGNVDKSCRRTISREEQVWQNELKDLIWLELQAKIAGRSLAQQDLFLCSQRNIIPTLIKNIIDYRFVNPNPCKGHSKRLYAAEGSREDLTSEEEKETEEDRLGCLSLECARCSQAIGRAMGELRRLLDAFHRAGALYPSTQAMTADHKLLATSLFQNRIKAMCLWYNMAMHMRLKLLAVRRLLRTIGANRRPGAPSFNCLEPELDERTCRDYDRDQYSHRHVHFSVSGEPTSSSNSDASTDKSQSDPEKSQSELEKSPSEPDKIQSQNDNIQSQTDKIQSETDKSKSEPDKSQLEPDKIQSQNDKIQSEPDRSQSEPDKRPSESEKKEEEKNKDETDFVFRPEQSGQTTPEIVISDAKYSTNDTSASSESGYMSERERWCRAESVFDVGSLADLTRLKLLGKCDVSPYREYHYEILKTQGVRRSMMFIHKLRTKLLCKVHLTFLHPETVLENSDREEDPTEASDEKDDKEKRAKEAQEDYELRRFGCWSEETLAMGLPSYRNHFLLLSSICMEAVHDYLTLRLEGRPEHPSCLTIKQLIHELKEGLDIATSMRQAFAAHVAAALRGRRAPAPLAPPAPAARRDLLLVVRTFDRSVEDVFKQYLSYLNQISRTEHMTRSSLEAEWSFMARVAERGSWVKQLSTAAFTDIACNQLNRVMKQFEDKLTSVAIRAENNSPDPNRYMFYTLCREAQSVFASEREAALQAAAFARALAAHHHTCPGGRRARGRIYETLMSFRECIVRHTKYILERASTNPPEEFLHEVTDGVVARVRDLLLQIYRLGFEIHKELHRFVNERSGAACGPRWRRSDSVADDGLARAFADIDCVDTRRQISIEELLSDTPPTPAPAQRARSASPDEAAWSACVARAIVAFARCWMRFVLERCERGRGRRPRWASQGLEFLMLACDPYNTRHLSDEEFEELKHLMDGCISHVVGSRARAPAPRGEGEPAAPRPRRRLHSPLPSTTPGAAPERTPSTPPGEPEPAPCSSAVEPHARTRSVMEAIKKLDGARDAALRDMRAVGRVAAAVDSYEPRVRQVTFKWQRGLKIGAGSFGKVYTVVNTETGQLLAMKEVSIGAGDRRATQRAAHELQVLEGVLHPHLVRYYGIEVHREEMLIFMELCVEGSLEALVATSGALPEHAVRRYTAQLLGAVCELHARSIAHRDIKSGNIFLMNEGHCLKLGDFGCAVKIRSTATAAGELQGYVGTQAYMAPEVFMKSDGHGRATDIWSLGCVVTEMASGKRPFSEYDSNYQIMFVVGMGGRPAVPETLSAEGQQFCRACLTHDPGRRPRAEELKPHHFLMVKNDESYECVPGKFL